MLLRDDRASDPLWDLWYTRDMPRAHPNDWYDWGSFAEGAARAFWASPYISQVENLAEDARQEERDGKPRRAEAMMAAYRALYPGSGGEWMDVLPPVPAAADRVGKAYARKVRDVLTTEDLHHLDDKMEDADQAGWYAAMQAQGEGVGWFDYSVGFDAPDWPAYDVKIQDAVFRAISKGIREAGIQIPRRG
jgi:hypothetical protein